MVGWLCQEFGFDKLDAYQLLTQVSESPVGNVCDPNYTFLAKVAKRWLPRVDPYREDVVPIETEIHVQQIPEGPHKQSRARDQKQRQRHLRDYQTRASPPAAARSRGRMKCRPETEQQNGKYAHGGGEAEYAKIRLDPDVQRQTGGVEVTDRRKGPVQKWHRRKRDEQSTRRAGKGE